MSVNDKKDHLSLRSSCCQGSPLETTLNVAIFLNVVANPGGSAITILPTKMSQYSSIWSSETEGIKVSGHRAMQYVSKRDQNTYDLFEGRSAMIANKEPSGHNFAEMLPTEMSVNIFSKLDIGSLCSAAVTCKQWNDIIEKSDYLWRNHCLTVRAVCQKEIDGDRGNGFSWKVTLERNYRKGYVKREWLRGRFSVIRSAEEMPDQSMCPLDAETWGEILQAELER
ncbi:hypothetical protein SKAU_G00147460 [Synaphobranchus kaupii]|uniref:F-box domain-containing protein n=1 Tax=Synaphobranchus kaupii TaxID=118154 RepID=A0A9Q1J505_SYNKA|nr:hypothetical protein SKAU_G00147460 [Synaphobranchus kaupii]